MLHQDPWSSMNGSNAKLMGSWILSYRGSLRRLLIMFWQKMKRKLQSKEMSC
uniref:Uncharacterized protein n=1 Tax=Arundo donax TaxID=35708 RepID=A0A0A9B9B2_ARUDO